MVAWPVSTNVKQLRGFLGLTGYYRRFIAHYASIASPLTELLKKDAFEWNARAAESFEKLKLAMTTAPVLRLPNFDLPFYIETDASDFGIGAVLLQEGHPLAYFSKKLGPRRRNASTYHKELYAIVEAVQKWRQYLLGREFIIRSDQKSLKELLQQVIQTPEQHFYVRKLMGYKFKIEYKTGASNRAADALSRRDPKPDSSGDLLTAVAHPIPRLLTNLRAETLKCPKLQAVQEAITAGSAHPQVSFRDGLLYFGRRIYVSPDSAFKEIIMREHHSIPLAGHPGVDRTFRRLASAFYWPRMRKDVKNFVASCVECQTTKYSTQKPAGLLQPLPIPTQVWEDVSMDFITGLPPSRGFTTIMVTVDRLSKYAHFAPLPTRFDSLKVAQLFIDTMVKHHGFPKTLVSDRDKIFLSAIWKDMLRLSGTTLHFSTAYHPQSDGQTEVRNRGLEQYLRAFTADRPNKWSSFLPWAELALNCFHHEGLGTSPFKALYGREPPALIAAAPSESTPPAVAELIRERGNLLVELRKNLSSAQQRMRATANRHRRDIHFEVGDLVLLKLQPYRQHSVANPQSAKLSRRFYGPFTIIERIGPVAYRLQLPDGCRVHNVFHVSLLRPFVENPASPRPALLPKEFTEGRPTASPIALLDRRITLQNGVPMEQGLVQWSEDESSAATWEPLDVIKTHFPSILLEDKEVAIGGGVDTSTIPEDAMEDEPYTSSEVESSSQEPPRAERRLIAVRERPQRLRRPPERYSDYVAR